MIGSRLFIHSDTPQHAAAWARALTSRMRERKLLDRYPDTKIVVLPNGEMQELPSHADRLYLRDALSRGSIIRQLGGDPREHFGGENDDLYEDGRAYFCDEILEEWRARQQRAFVVRMLGGWGSPYPQIVFVGDRYNGPRDAQLPFSNKTGASKTLSDLLNAAKLWERDLHFLNAYAPDGSTALEASDLAFLRAQEIVALGSNAAQRLEEIGVTSYERFPHPRFLMCEKDIQRWGDRLAKQLSHVTVL